MLQFIGAQRLQLYKSKQICSIPSILFQVAGPSTHTTADKGLTPNPSTPFFPTPGPNESSCGGLGGGLPQALIPDELLIFSWLTHFCSNPELPMAGRVDEQTVPATC